MRSPLAEKLKHLQKMPCHRSSVLQKSCFYPVCIMVEGVGQVRLSPFFRVDCLAYHAMIYSEICVSCNFESICNSRWPSRLPLTPTTIARPEHTLDPAFRLTLSDCVFPARRSRLPLVLWRLKRFHVLNCYLTFLELHTYIFPCACLLPPKAKHSDF